VDSDCSKCFISRKIIQSVRPIWKQRDIVVILHKVLKLTQKPSIVVAKALTVVSPNLSGCTALTHQSRVSKHEIYVILFFGGNTYYPLNPGKTTKPVCTFFLLIQENILYSGNVISCRPSWALSTEHCQSIIIIYFLCSFNYYI